MKFDLGKLKERRMLSGLSIRQLARKAGVSSGQLGRYEKGSIQNPRPGTIAKIAKALNMEIKDFIAF